MYSRFLEKSRIKTPTPLTESVPHRSRTPVSIPTKTVIDPSIPRSQTDYLTNPSQTFDRQTTLTRSARDLRSSNAPLPRSKTPGPEFDYPKSSVAPTMKPRSKTPTAYEFASNSLQNRFRFNRISIVFINLSFRLSLI